MKVLGVHSALARLLAGAVALTSAVALGAPAHAAPVLRQSADPGAPFTLPALTAQSVIGSPDELRTGGVNCARPADLAASDAGDGSGNGYRVPFTMALTDGRTLAGYSEAAKAADQMPFGTGALGITGWVRGWVTLPSLEIDVPSDGVTVCPGAGGYWSFANFDDTQSNTPIGSYYGLAACPTCFTSTNFAVTVDGPVQAALDGVASDGSLRLQATMPLSVDIQTHYSNQPADSPNLDCVTEGTLTFSTDQRPLVTSFHPVPTPFTQQDFTSAGFPEAYVTQYPVHATPPDHYYLPPRTLAGATPGATATLADATFELSTPHDDPAKPGHCSTNGAVGTSFISNVLDPKDSQGNAPINYDNAYAFGAPSDVGWRMQAGSAQASVDATIASIGMQKGMPDGYGFK